MNVKRILQRLYPNIDVRVTLPFLLVIIVTALIAVFIVTRLTASTIQERLDNQLVASAQNAEDSIVLIEENYLAALRLMTFTEGVSQAIAANDADQLQMLLRGIVANENLDDVIVIDADAHPVTRINGSDFPPLTADVDIALPTVIEWQAVQRVLQSDEDTQGDKFIAFVDYETLTVLYFVAPVRDGAGEVVGAVAAGIAETTLARVLRNQSLSEIALYQQDGRYIVSTLADESSAPPIPPEDIEAIFTATLDSAPIQETTIGDTPYQFLFTDWEIRSETMGILAVALPVDFVASRLNTSRNTFIYLFAALFVAITMLGFGIAQSIIRPVFHMVSTTRAIRSGDLSRRVGLRMPDELGELSESFDHMTDQLVQRNQEISQLYEQQVQETARRTAMLESIRDILIVLDKDNQILLLNDSAKQFIKDLRAEKNTDLVSEFWEICYHPDNYQTPVTRHLLDRDLSVQATYVRLDEDETLGHVVVMRDITSILDAERLKDEIILQLSHELRTPLTAARGYADLARMLGAEQKDEHIDKSVEQLDLLGKMINQVIEVSVMLSNRLDLDIEPINLNELLRDVADDHREAIDAADIDFRLVLPDDTIHLEGDYERLHNAVSHVLQNAYYYTLEGGKIRAVLDRLQNGQAVIVIDDTGVGIAADEEQKVFERMYRGRSADAGPTDKRGLGLGLFMARGVVEAHGGKIALASKLEVGTSVGICLPVTQNNEDSGSHASVE